MGFVADHSEARAGALAERALRAMDANPLWGERFAQRERTRRADDLACHVS